MKTGFAMAILAILTGMHMSSALHLGQGVLHRYYPSAHTHLMLVGGSAMIGMGVALWKLPPGPAESRLRPRLDALAYWGVTLTTLGRYVLECWVGYLDPEPTWMHQGITWISMLQGSSLILFLLNQWPRLRSRSG